MNHFPRTILIVALLGFISNDRAARGQIVNSWTNGGAGNWSNTANWSGGLFGPAVPDISESDIAVITNGGQANVSSAVSQTPGGVILGQANSQSGALSIQSGGSLTVVQDAGLPDTTGAVIVGQAASGLGSLTVARGGALTAVALNSGGSADSSITLGGLSGSGMATINVTDANWTRSTRVIGPNVDFTATNSLTLGGNLIAQITSATSHSAVKANELAILGGTLTAEFSPGVTPVVGSTWNIVNARQIAGTFADVNLTGAPELALGQVYNVRTQSGGLGKLVQLAVVERLVLNVNRNTGAVSIDNPGTSAISLDGYTIISPTLGALNPGNWTPLTGTWQVANSSPTRISQLNPDAAPSFGVSSSQPLGGVFAPPVPSEFGTSTEDIAFEYTQPDGSVRTGVVNYTGITGINNLTLRVDPGSGAAQLRNTSSFDVELDAYTIASAMGSLDTAQWSSLDDQNAAGGDWQEASISSNRLSELKFAGAVTLAAGQFFDLGNPFNETVGKKDVIFQFALRDEDFTRTGVVVYETISASLDGDFNSDGTVDAADYVVWRKSIGTPSAYNLWRANFGMRLGSGSGAASAGIATGAVPEPTTLFLLLAACGVVMVRRTRCSEK